MRRRGKSVGSVITVFVSLLLLIGTLATPAAAAPGNSGGQPMRAMAIASFVVDTNERNVVAGGTSEVVVGFGGTTGGLDTTFELVPTNVTEGLVIAPINCGECIANDPVTYLFDGGSPSYTATLRFNLVVPSDASAGETFTLGITANESSVAGVNSSYGEVAFTVVAPATDTPLPTETPAPTQTPITPTATPFTPTSTATATVTETAPPTSIPTGTVAATATATAPPSATTTPTPTDTGASNVRARITSADLNAIDEIPGGSELRILQGGSEIYAVTIGASGSTTPLPIGGTQGASLNTNQVPVDFAYGIYTVSFDAGAGFEPFVQNVDFDSPVETIDVILVPALGEGESSVDIQITSSDPDLVDDMGEDTRILLTQGNRVEFDGTLVAANLLPLPRTLSFTDPIDFGVYTLTIDAGEAFEVYTAQVVINESPEQLVIVELQALSLADRLVEVLKRVIEEILAGG